MGDRAAAAEAGPAAPSDRIGAVIDRAPSVAALTYHRLGALAAPRWRERGLEVPDALAEEEHLGAVCSVAAPAALERVAGISSQPLLLLKGPEVARHHPSPHGRPYRDLDLLAQDPRGAFEELVAAGARVIKDLDVAHHEPPVVFEDLPLVIEVHRTPKWPKGFTAPGSAEVFATAVPAPWGGGLVLTPPPSHHAVIVAAHAWAHRPLRRLMDLLDLAVMLEAGDRAEASAIAGGWGVASILASSTAAADAIFGDGKRPLPLRSWARNLPAVRERSPREAWLERYLAPFSAHAPLPASRRGARRLAQRVRTRASSRAGGSGAARR